MFIQDQFVLPRVFPPTIPTCTAAVWTNAMTCDPLRFFILFFGVCVCVFGHKINHISIDFSQFLNTSNYSLVSDKLKALTLIANITPTTRQSIQLPSRWEQLAVMISSHSLTPVCTQWGEEKREENRTLPPTGDLAELAGRGREKAGSKACRLSRYSTYILTFQLNQTAFRH